MDRQNQWIRLWNSTSESTATTSRTMVRTPTISWVFIQQYPECYHQLYTLLRQQGLSSEHHCPLWTSHWHMPKFSSLTLTSWPTTSVCTLPKLNADTQYLLILTESTAPESGSSQVYVKAQFFHNDSAFRNSPTNFLDHTSLHSQHHSVHPTTPHSPWAIHPVFHVLMLEPTYPNPILDQVQPPPLAIMVDYDPSLKSQILDSKDR